MTRSRQLQCPRSLALFLTPTVSTIRWPNTRCQLAVSASYVRTLSGDSKQNLPPEYVNGLFPPESCGWKPAKGRDAHHPPTASQPTLYTYVVGAFFLSQPAALLLFRAFRTNAVNKPGPHLDQIPKRLFKQTYMSLSSGFTVCLSH